MNNLISFFATGFFQLVSVLLVIPFAVTIDSIGVLGFLGGLCLSQIVFWTLVYPITQINIDTKDKKNEH